MAGLYLNDQKVFRKFKDWYNETILERGRKYPLCAHVSEFFPANISRDKLFEGSLALFLECVGLVKEKSLDGEVMPALVIPLLYSDKLHVWDDSISLSDQLHDMEPPSLYLIEYKIAKYFEKVEEYRVPVELDLGWVELTKKNFSIYYRCHRSIEEIENDWEYSRAIYLEYYPDNLLMTSYLLTVN